MTRKRTKKSPAQLDREIASSLSERGESQLAALFADPEARKTFAKEMRHEILKKQLSQKSAAAFAAKPFSVKRMEQRGDRLFADLRGRYATEAEARDKADAVGGWVEHEGRIIYGKSRVQDR